jgi:peptidoglycan hydrolase-like protein with peptidoglycan-binding domain
MERRLQFGDIRGDRAIMLAPGSAMASPTHHRPDQEERVRPTATRVEAPAAPAVELARELQRTAGNQATRQFLSGARAHLLQRKISAPRFQGDAVLTAIDEGSRVLTSENARREVAPGVPRAVRVVQQALQDLGGDVGVTGSYDEATASAVGRVHPSALEQFDQRALGRLDAVFATHKLDAMRGKQGPTEGRSIAPGEKPDIDEALVPPAPRDAVTGERIPFKPDDAEAYQREALVAMYYLVKELSAGLKEKSASRSEDALHSWSSIEQIGVLAKDATDAIFGRYNQQPPLVRGTHLTDRWEEITKSVETMSAPQQLEVAEEVAFKYLRNSPRIAAINARYNMDLSKSELVETVVKPLVIEPIAGRYRDEFLEMNRHQPGSATPGTGQVKIQRFKGEDPEEDSWRAFKTLVHEYIHTLAPGKYYAYVNNLDAERKFTLTEGITDAFTRVVLDTLSGPMAALKEKYAPGPYRGTYAAAADRAEQLIGQIGLRNAYAGYFLGQVDLLGGPALV